MRSMRFVFMMAVLALDAGPTSADAQEPDPLVAPSGEVVPFEFKGVRVGDTAASHANKWAGVSKGMAACSHASGRFGIPMMYCDFADGSVSGVRFSLSAGFGADGALREISGLGDLDSLELVRAAFEQKYGRSSEASKISFSSTFNRNISYNRYAWEFTDGILYLSPELSLDKKRIRTEILFLSFDYMHQIRDNLPKPRVDF